MAEELFHRIMQMADNAGATDEHRALQLSAPSAIRPSTPPPRTPSGATARLRRSRSGRRRLSGVRRIVEVIFSFTNRQTDVTEKFFVRVDVTEEFPFLVTKLSPYYDR